MENEPDSAIPKEYELDWLAWNLPRPSKDSQPQEPPSPLQSGREGESEAETEAA